MKTKLIWYSCIIKSLYYRVIMFNFFLKNDFVSCRKENISLIWNKNYFYFFLIIEFSVGNSDNSIRIKKSENEISINV